MVLGRILVGEDKLTIEEWRLVGRGGGGRFSGGGGSTGESARLVFLLIKPKMSHELLDLIGDMGRALGQNIDRLDAGGLEDFNV